MISFFIESFHTADKEKTELNNRRVIMAMLVICFVFILALTAFTPLYDDDYNYSDVHNIVELFSKVFEMYFIWGGRLVPFFIVRLSLMLPKAVFNLLNAYVYCSLLFFIYQHSNRNKKTNPVLFLFITAAAWLTYPVFGQTVLWVTGSGAYLWLSLIVMIFMYKYIEEINPLTYDKDKKSIMKKTIAMFLFGLVSGCCIETLSGGCILFCLLYIIYELIYKIKPAMWQYSGLLGVIFGFIIQMLSPGTDIRLSLLPKSTDSFSVKYLTRFSTLSETFIDLFLGIVIVYMILLIVLLFTSKDSKAKWMALIYGVCAFAMSYALILSPYAPERAFFNSAVLFITAAGFCIAQIFDDQPANKILCCAISGVVAAYALTSAFLAVPDIMLTKIEANNRESIINAQLENGNVNIIAPLTRDSVTDYNAKNALTADLSLIRENNLAFNNVYDGMETIVGIPKEEWNKIYAHADYDLINCLYLSDYSKQAAGKDYVYIVMTIGDMGDIVASQTQELSVLGCTLEGTLLDENTFVGVYKGGQALFEEISSGTLTVNLSEINGLEDCNLTVVSDATNSSVCSLRFSGLEYIRRDPGLCVLAYDSENNRIVDRAIFSAGDGSVFK